MKRNTKQCGATLVTALVMLVVLTLLVLSAINASTTNLRIAGNMQVREESIAAGQQAIEQVISNNFTISPVSSTAAVTIGKATYAVNVAQPTCMGSRPLLPSTDPNLPEVCQPLKPPPGMSYPSGVPAIGIPLCYAQQWDVRASVVDANTGAAATLHQGVTLKVPVGTACPSG